MPANFPKKILTVVIVIFIIQFLFFNLVLAQGDASVKFTPQIGIPGTEFQKGAEIPIPNTTAKIGEYIKAFYIFIISALAILSVVMIAWAGITWLTAGGSAEKVGTAKARILGALGGLALGLLSYVILQTVNPDLVNFKITTIEVVKAQHCCQKQGSCGYEDQEACKAVGGKWKENYICGASGQCVQNSSITLAERYSCSKGKCRGDSEGFFSTLSECESSCSISCRNVHERCDENIGNQCCSGLDCVPHPYENYKWCDNKFAPYKFWCNTSTSECKLMLGGTFFRQYQCGEFCYNKHCGTDKKGVCAKIKIPHFGSCLTASCPTDYKKHPDGLSAHSECGTGECCCVNE